MRYFLALLAPIGLVVLVFSVLAILTSVAEGWSPGTQSAVASVVVWWAHYWWMITIVLASICVILATFHEASAPAKRKQQ